MEITIKKEGGVDFLLVNRSRKLKRSLKAAEPAFAMIVIVLPDFFLPLLGALDSNQIVLDGSKQ
jgi:hypothetical protein